MHNTCGHQLPSHNLLCILIFTQDQGFPDHFPYHTSSSSLFAVTPLNLPFAPPYFLVWIGCQTKDQIPSEVNERSKACVVELSSKYAYCIVIYSLTNSILSPRASYYIAEDFACRKCQLNPGKAQCRTWYSKSKARVRSSESVRPLAQVLCGLTH